MNTEASDARSKLAAVLAAETRGRARFGSYEKATQVVVPSLKALVKQSCPEANVRSTPEHRYACYIGETPIKWGCALRLHSTPRGAWACLGSYVLSREFQASKAVVKS